MLRACQFDLHDPGQREALVVTAASALASGFFWTISLCTRVASSPSLVCFSLSSFVDVASTLYVLFRFSKKDALAPTSENAATEMRAAVVVDLSFILLALVSISFAAYALGAGIKPRWSELRFETCLAIPAQAIYLAIGMLQLNIGSRLRSSSLTKDGILSVFSAVAGVCELTGAIMNIFSTSRYEYEAAWWLDPMLSIALSTIMLFYGYHAIMEETRLGAQWWRIHFWMMNATEARDTYEKGEAVERGQTRGEASRLTASLKK